MRRLELTDQDAEVLIQLLDFSVRAEGLAVAQACATLVERIQSAEQYELEALDKPEPEKRGKLVAK